MFTGDSILISMFSHIIRQNAIYGVQKSRTRSDVVSICMKGLFEQIEEMLPFYILYGIHHNFGNTHTLDSMFQLRYAKDVQKIYIM